MTRKYVLYVVSVVILVSLGFGIVFSVENQTGAIYENEEEESDFCLEMDSDVRSEDCFLCGKRNNSLMPYYSKRDSIGIIHWNHQSICDTEVRAYDDDGNEILGQKGSNSRISFLGDGYGSIHVSGIPNRGFTNVQISYTDRDTIDFDAVKEILCQDCLDKVIGFYVDQKNYGLEDTIGTYGYSLVDFSTKEVYTLSELYRGYLIRDYYVRYDMTSQSDGKGGDINLFIVYVPERK